GNIRNCKDDCYKSQRGLTKQHIRTLHRFKLVYQAAGLKMNFLVMLLVVLCFAAVVFVATADHKMSIGGGPSQELVQLVTNDDGQIVGEHSIHSL
ncbi:unnamed protein product, partial [Larinioides sclopetarius]